MADINKLRVSGTDYDVGDVTARAGLSAKQDKATVSTTIPTTLVDNTIYNITNISTLDLSSAFPSTPFDCIINLTTASSGTITITFPTSIYQPAVPTFGNGETWTLWIRNNPVGSGGIVTASKAVAS